MLTLLDPALPFPATGWDVWQNTSITSSKGFLLPWVSGFFARCGLTMELGLVITTTNLGKVLAYCWALPTRGGSMLLFHAERCLF